MLQAMRDRVMGWVGWIIMGLIIVTFALFGLGSYLQDKAVTYVAKVNDVEITPRELQQAYQQQRDRVEQMLGDAFDPSIIDEKVLRRHALDSLIRKQLLLQEAEKEGLAISDQLLAMSIHSIPGLQEDGRFSDEKYRRALMQRGLTPAGFEYDTRQLLLADQLNNGIGNSTIVTDAELDRAYRLQAQKRDFAYLLIPAKNFENDVEVSDEQVQEYFDAHQEDFMVPERVRLSWVELSGDELGKTVEVDEEELRSYYDEKKESLTEQEQRKASHILITVPPDADDKVVEEKRALAEDLLKQIREGADFAELAREYSSDPGSAAKGGELGYFARGVMVPEFDEAAFSMKPGEVSDVVRTQFGFHIIKLEDVRGEKIPSLEESRDQLVRELQQRSVDDLYYEQLELLTDLAYENPESLEAVADQMGLEVKTSDWITEKGGPGPGQYPAVVAAAFSEDVLEQGNNSEPVEVDSTRAIVVRVEEREPSKPSALEDVKDRIVAILRRQAAEKLAEEKGQTLLATLEEGAALDALKDEEGLTYMKAEGVERDAQGYNTELVTEIFKLPWPGGDTPLRRGIRLKNGDYAVVQLTRVEDGDPSSMPDDVREQMRRGLENLKRMAMLNTLVQDLRSRAEVIIPQDSE